jgi:hypothetical protein
LLRDWKRKRRGNRYQPVVPVPVVPPAAVDMGLYRELDMRLYICTRHVGHLVVCMHAGRGRVEI